MIPDIYAQFPEMHDPWVGGRNLHPQLLNPIHTQQLAFYHPSFRRLKPQSFALGSMLKYTRIAHGHRFE